MRAWVEADQGSAYALVAGELHVWAHTPAFGYVSGYALFISDELLARLKHYLARHGRAFATLEEAEFVLFGGTRPNVSSLGRPTEQ